MLKETDIKMYEAITDGAVKLAKEIWVLAVGCKKHPGYRYKKPSTCGTCQRMYHLAKSVNLHGSSE